METEKLMDESMLLILQNLGGDDLVKKMIALFFENVTKRIDGVTAVQKIKENVNTHHIPIIMLTVESKRETVVNSMKYNVGGYVLKPFNPPELLEKIIAVMTESPAFPIL